MDNKLIEIEYKGNLDFSEEILKSYTPAIIDIFTNPINIDKYINTDDNKIKIIIATYYLSDFNKDKQKGLDILMELYENKENEVGTILGCYYIRQKDYIKGRKYLLNSVEKKELLGLSNLSHHYIAFNEDELFFKYMNIINELYPDNELFYINMALYKLTREKNTTEFYTYIDNALNKSSPIAYYLCAHISTNKDEKIKYIINAINIKIKKIYVKLLKENTTIEQRTLLLLKENKYDRDFLLKLDDNIIDSNINIVHTNNKCPICMKNNDNYLIKFKCNHSFCITCCSNKYKCVICNT